MVAHGESAIMVILQAASSVSCVGRNQRAFTFLWIREEPGGFAVENKCRG